MLTASGRRYARWTQFDQRSRRARRARGLPRRRTIIVARVCDGARRSAPHGPRSDVRSKAVTLVRRSPATRPTRTRTRVPDAYPFINRTDGADDRRHLSAAMSASSGELNALATATATTSIAATSTRRRMRRSKDRDRVLGTAACVAAYSANSDRSSARSARSGRCSGRSSACSFSRSESNRPADTARLRAHRGPRASSCRSIRRRNDLIWHNVIGAVVCVVVGTVIVSRRDARTGARAASTGTMTRMRSCGNRCALSSS